MIAIPLLFKFILYQTIGKDAGKRYNDYLCILCFFLLVILIELGNSVYIHLCYGIISTSFCQFACL